MIGAIGCSHRHGSENSEHDEEDNHAHGISISPEQASEFGLEFEEVSAAPFSDVIKTSGSLEASATDIFTASAKKSGIITLMPGMGDGKEVKNGETIAMISARGVEGGDASQAAMVNLQATRKEYERLKPLFEEGLVTASTFREAERAYHEAEALAGNGKGGSSAVNSPTSGTIQTLFVKNGEYVEIGSPVASVAKNSDLRLVAYLPVREIKHLPDIASANFLPEGGAEIIKLSDLNGKRISGNVANGNINGYVPLYFSFTGNALSSPPGFAEVYLLCGERENVISVPRDALVEIQGNKYVYVCEDEHGYEKRLVTTGATDGERVEVKQGLSGGEKIVSKGASIVRMAEVSAVAPPSHNHNH